MAEIATTLAQRWIDLLAEEGFRPHLEVNEAEPERMMCACSQSADRFFKRLGEAHRPMTLAS